MQFLQLKQ